MDTLNLLSRFFKLFSPVIFVTDLEEHDGSIVQKFAP